MGNKARKAVTNDPIYKHAETDEERKTLSIVLYRAYYKKYVQDLKNDLTMAEEDGGLKDVLNEMGYPILKAEQKLKENWWWITLRPGNEHKDRFTDFLVQTFKYLDREMFIMWKAAFEQKGNTTEEIGTGYHVHIIAQLKDRYHLSRVIKDTKSTWDKFLGGYVPDPFVKAVKLTSIKELQIKSLYINGNKSDKDKKQAVELDPVWRKSINIQDSYYSKNWKEPS